MITLVDSLPLCNEYTIEQLKIYCTFDCYSDIGLFWVQDNGNCLISMLDGNMVIANKCAKIDELKEFIGVVSPRSVFSDANTLLSLGMFPFEKVYVMKRFAQEYNVPDSDRLSSKQIYDMLNVKELSLPDYPDFAVDYCYRLNHGYANYYAKKDAFAAVSFCHEQFCFINGIVSNISGGGTAAIRGIMSQNANKTVYACCRKNVCGFYEKNGFSIQGESGYWVR